MKNCYFLQFLTFVFGITLLSSCAGTRKAQSFSAFPAPLPTPNLSAYPVRVTSEGTVQIGEFYLSPFGENCGPMPILYGVLKKYPTNSNFQMMWEWGLGGQSSDSKVFYSRKAKTLNLDFRHSWGEGDFSEEKHICYAQVTDELLQKAATQIQKQGLQVIDGGFSRLSIYGCKQVKFETKKLSKWQTIKRK